MRQVIGIKPSLVVLCVLAVGSLARGETTQAPQIGLPSSTTPTTTGGSTTQSPTGNSSATTPTTSRPTATTVPTLPSSGNAGQASGAAGGAAASQMLGVGMSVAMGGMFASQCGKANKMACAMAAMSFAQAASTLGTSSGARNSGNAMSTNLGTNPWQNTADGTSNPTVEGTCPTCAPGTSPGDNANPNISGSSNKNDGSNKLQSQIVKDFNALGAKLTANGVKLSADKKSAILPGGKKVEFSSMGNADGMKSNGFSDAEVQAAQALIKAAQAKAQSQIKAIAMTAEGAGGGGGGGFNHGGGADKLGSGFNFKMPGEEKKRGANVSGMSKTLGTDRIGVAGDDIFEMVKRRYKARDSQNEFIK